MIRNISPYVYIGYYCNNNCVFCSEADEYLQSIKKKSFKEIKKEILETRKQYDFISFMGREPTLRNDISDILKFAVSLKFRQVGIATNGRMFSYPRFTKEILDTGIKQVGVSLSGATAKTHDKLTQASGSFEQTIKGIRNIVKFKKPEASLLVNLNLTRLNYFEFKQMLDLLIGLGVKEINILFIAPLSKRSRSKNIVMQMSKLGKYVFNILKPYLGNPELKFLLVEFLPCSLPREAKRYFFPCLEKNPHKVKIPICNNCEYKDKCDGVLQTYIDLYGIKEFKL